MTNVYDYNRKPHEEDEEILAAVKRHHDAISAEGFLVVMTSLVGSQNYDLDHPNSDIDTFSLVYPPLKYIASAEAPYNRCYVLNDGHAEVKDIRIAINLLQKSSPNSVEYFTSKYKIYNPIFEPILKEYLDDNTKLWNMIHCNYNHMLYAITGMAHQLVKRNMPAGKRYAHAIRLQDMLYHFLNSCNACAVLEFRIGGNRDIALAAKLDTDLDEKTEANYNEEYRQIAKWLENYKNNFTINEEQEQIQQYGLALISSFQWKLFRQYLKETNKEWN